MTVINCREVRRLLVALDDGELSPGEHALVRDHLTHCSACRVRHQRLRQVRPAPAIEVPAVVQTRMEHRLSGQRLEALARQPAPRSWRPAWLVREARLPAGALVAYGALLVVLLAWGLSNWVEARSLALALEHSTVPVEVVPAEQFRPAAWSPEQPATEAPPAEDELF